MTADEQAEIAETPSSMSASETAQGPKRLPRRNPLFAAGGSVYPLRDEADGPEEWYAHDVTPELDLLARAGCSTVRFFVGWRVLEPQVGQYDQEIIDRLGRLVSAAEERRLQVIVCFFADDRHAELSSVSWGARRDPRTDSYLVQREAALVARVASALHRHKGVFAWQLGNEAFLSGFSATSDLEAWTRTLRDAIREHDSKRPIGLGADAETLYRSSGVDARAAVALCDFSVAHLTSAYRAYMGGDPLTGMASTYVEPFLLRCGRGTCPVLLDETGPLSLEYSAAEEAHALRIALWSALGNRAAGAMVRRVSDMSTERREPYYLDPFEMLVGVMAEDGETKPSFDELQRFVRTIARLDLKTYAVIAERAAVLIPAERYEPLPSLAGLYAPRSCLQAFVTAKRAQLQVTIAHEGEALNDYRLVVVPSTAGLREDTWPALKAFVQAGGTLLFSHGGGDLPSVAAGLFGIEFLGDGGPRETLSCRVAQVSLLGALESFDAVLSLPHFAQVSAQGATVVATDAAGLPLLTVHQVGQGRAVFIAAPLERAIAQGDPWASPPAVLHLLREVYSAAARIAGCGAPFSCDTPEVEVTVLAGETDDVLLLINHSTEKLTATLTAVQEVAEITDVAGGKPVRVGSTSFGVPLGPCAVAALKLSYD